MRAGIVFARRRFLAEESGQVLIMTAVAMTVLLGILAFAIDVGQMRYTRRQMQAAADAAAVAGALQLPYCSGTGTSCSYVNTAAQQALAENNLSGATVINGCTGGAGTGLTVRVNIQPCLLAADPNNGKGGYVEVAVTQSQPTYFAKVLGINAFPLAVRSEAARAGNAFCMYALDPTDGSSFSVAGFASVSAPCGIWVESSSSSALSCGWLAGIHVTRISIHGGYQAGFFCGISPTPKTHLAVPSPADPLSYVPKPAVPACGAGGGGVYHGSAQKLYLPAAGNNVTLYPDGAYCGGIEIDPGATVNFMPGTYVLKSKSASDGGLYVSLGTAVNGNGVTFYNYGPNGAITFAGASVSFAGVNLVAPTTGTYKGILFFQDPGDTAAATILGSPDWNTTLQGIYYFPKAAVNFAFTGPVSYNALIAYQISFSMFSFGTSSTTSTFGNDYSSLPTGTPLVSGGNSAALIE